MPLRLDIGDPGFAAAFDRLVNARREADSDVSASVRDMIARVRAEGDTALAELTARFDGFDLDMEGWSISAEQCAAAFKTLDRTLRDAIETAAQRVAAYHVKQRPVTTPGPTMKACAWAIAGTPWQPPASMCRGGSPLIPRRC